MVGKKTYCAIVKNKFMRPFIFYCFLYMYFFGITFNVVDVIRQDRPTQTAICKYVCMCVFLLLRWISLAKILHSMTTIRAKLRSCLQFFAIFVFTSQYLIWSDLLWWLSFRVSEFSAHVIVSHFASVLVCCCCCLTPLWVYMGFNFCW